MLNSKELKLYEGESFPISGNILKHVASHQTKIKI